MKKFVSAIESIAANFKSIILVPALFIFVAVLARVIVFSDHKHPVQYQKAVEHPGYATDSAFYQVYVSPAQSWELTHQTFVQKLGSTLADLFFWAAIALLILASVDLLNVKKPLPFIVGCLLIWGLLKYTNYSNGLGYYVRVSESEYQKAKDSPEGLDVFFYGKKLY